ncbi:MAG: glycosyltransferase [Anaerolineae bacterium]
MDWLITLLTIVYVLSALALTVYASSTLVLIAIWLVRARLRHEEPSADAIASWPVVLVQLPVFNERLVIGRLIDAVAALDYPRDRLIVQVLDDSTDDTPELIAQKVAQVARTGLLIAHVRRRERTGYKAGALNYGLACVPQADLVAVFDADFVPPADFLRRVVPYFVKSAQLGMVQTRWAHLNADHNWLTRAQALSLDGHFVIEQTARSRGGLLMNFSGSGGVWRAECIRSAGGWSFDTLAEDLDLSYRAQLQGWRFLYLPELAVPAEIPPQIAAYRQQQARWAKGSTQNLLLHFGALWRSRRFRVVQKLMGTFHLAQYVVHPIMLVLLMLTPLLLATGALQRLPLAPLGLAGMGPPLLFLLSQRHLYDAWPRRLLAIPVLMLVGTGLSLNNSLAVVDALRGNPNVFYRTPKFDRMAWQQSRYALRHASAAFGEACLAAYAVFGIVLAVRHAPALVPFLFIYAASFGTVALWSILEAKQVQRQGPRQQSVREQAPV